MKYSKFEPSDTRFNDELMTVKLRYKEPDADVSKLLTVGTLDRNVAIENASDNLRFASAVAEFGLILRDSRYKGSSSFSNIRNLANSALGNDFRNYRNDFLNLIGKANALKN